MACTTIAPPPVPRLRFPRKMQCLFWKKRYKVFYGGRGGAKSWNIARALIQLAVSNKLRILCAREFQNSIKESVHHLLVQQIEILGFQAYFSVTDKTITGNNGSEFIFAGLRNNIKSIKSAEGIDICWVEEAETVSAHSWAILIPTIRKDGSEIWVSFNPDEESDPTYQMFVVKPPADAVVVQINWRNNPWFPDTLLKEKDSLYAADPEAAAHIWEGKCNTRSQSQIFLGKYTVEAFEPHETWDGPYFGMDFGFSTDPAAVIKSWVWERKLYIEHEAFGYGVMNDDLPALVRSVPGADNHVIRADCARPETIAHLCQHGLNVVPGKKWQGCVEDGIAFIRTFDQVVIHSRCRHMIDEARLYRYKVDRLTGDILPIIVDKHNHGWDAERYALEPMINSTAEAVAILEEDNVISPDLDQADFGNW